MPLPKSYYDQFPTFVKENKCPKCKGLSTIKYERLPLLVSLKNELAGCPIETIEVMDRICVDCKYTWTEVIRETGE